MADLRAQLQEGLGTAYTLERELGRGGMATVFLARDLKHDRPVALKVIHPELAASLGSERFLREIKLAARLQHPHILTVLDSGDTAGRLWFTMPLVEGESLRDRLRRERQLPIEDALRIAREAAQALQYAHGHGVIHRDIKPENLLLTDDGNTLVADFGIARSLGGSHDEKLTETGLVVGTPAYMSPEQAAGDRGLDVRSDVYSLAAVLYEMLTGEPPFTGATTQAMLVRRLTEPAPSARSVRANLPDGADQAIRKALSPVAADRFATMAEFGRELVAGRGDGGTAEQPATTAVQPPSRPSVQPSRRPAVPLAASALVLGILIGLGVLFAWRRSNGDGHRGARLVAVLPFENIGDSTEEYFADGITDEVRGKLTGLAGLEVIAGRSSSQYKHTDKDLAQIARELGATHLVTAKVRWAKAADGSRRVQVSPELVQVAPGGSPTTEWQQSFDATMTDVFKVQAEVATRVAEELGVALADSTRRELAARPTENLQAYDLYLRGEAASFRSGRMDPTSLRTSAALFERAVALDSNFGLAWARLASARTLAYTNAPSPALKRQARAALDRALVLAPEETSTVLAMLSYYRNIEGNAEPGLRAVKAALARNPNDPRLLSSVGNQDITEGRIEEGLATLQKAQRLDPRSVGIAASIAVNLGLLRRYEAADSQYARVLELEPASMTNIHFRILTRLGLGDLPGAREVVRKAVADLDTRTVAVYLATYNELFWVLDSAQQAVVIGSTVEDFDGDRGSWGLSHANILAAWGDRARSRAYADSARAAFTKDVAENPDDAQLHSLLGLALALMGRTDEAVEYGERGVALRPVAQNPVTAGYMEEILARIYVMAGQPEKAVEQLETILRHQAFISRAFLRIDPHYAPIRSHPAFVRLVSGSP